MLELRVIKIRVETAFGEEFVVGAFFDDVAFVHDKNQVGILDCGEAVGDDEGRFVLHKHFEGLLDFDFRTSVD